MKKYMNPEISVSVFDTENICTTASAFSAEKVEGDAAITALKAKGAAEIEYLLVF